ncbi:myocardin-related transcription factor B isoform X2 [Periophthalmus magnuspinnatus]|uniref:myocardin-related transcription factor B isoform X2 n=1 Tax=Periophthalmus magnuspinnatus TaxID=409849 RepID=UPI0024368476|nr:myocardin-related transcription factor B isoform X2 [Periophthalmus magnuspinnatus]
MGLQSWTSAVPLSPMACLQVETPPICRGKFKTALKAPAVFHEQIRSLERARTGTFLKHKLCSRPERSELVRMHILQETQADSSLQAAQLRLKKARLADSLNEKISQRPGPMELVEKNILPVQSEDKEAGNGDELSNIKTPDVYSFDEDSSDGSSPGSQKSDSSTSSRESGDKESARSPACNSHKQSSPKPQSIADVSQSSEKQNYFQISSSPTTALVHNITPGPVLVKQSLSRTAGEKSRSKKSRDPKPRVKKLKYHQYIPPHQKQEHDPVPMDSAYARLLEQQQQFLQLQILSQQQFSYSTVQPPAIKQTSEVQSSCCSGNVTSLNLVPNQTNHKSELPANLEDMKVAELKAELKLRSLPVSGTKIDLIERLRSYHENRMDILSPPVSPIATKVSKLGLKDSVPCETPDCPGEGPEEGDKDQRLFEKERQIEELMRKLEQEQRLVEELKMQLEVEKRFQQGDSPPPVPCPALIQVKQEVVTPLNCSGTSSLCPVPPSGVKQEVIQRSIVHPVLMSMNLPNPGSSSPGLLQNTGPNTKVSAQLQQHGTAQKAWTDAAVLTTFSSNQTSADKVHNEASLLLLPHKSKDPPRYEEAVKQTRGLISQCPSVSSQQMDDLFDVLIETGEILPFVKPEPHSLDQPLPVTASVTTLPINTVFCRPPAVVQVAQPPLLSAQSLAHKQTEALHSPLHSIHMEFEENTSDSHIQNEDSMDWLDLTDMSAHVGIFASDFLDSNEMQLSWE